MSRATITFHADGIRPASLRGQPCRLNVGETIVNAVVVHVEPTSHGHRVTIEADVDLPDQLEVWPGDFSVKLA